MKAKDAGVTLVEICLTGIILSCLFMVAWPAFSRVALETKLETSCKSIAATLIFARDRALAESKCYRVSFDSALHRAAIEVEESPADNPGEFTPLEDFQVRGKMWPDEIQLKEISGSAVVFNQDGTAGDWSLSLRNARGAVGTVKLQGAIGRCVTEYY